MNPEILGVVPGDSAPEAKIPRSSNQELPLTITKIKGRAGHGPRSITVEPYMPRDYRREDRIAENVELTTEQQLLTEAGSASTRGQHE
jgi:hypothetical protein